MLFRSQRHADLLAEAFKLEEEYGSKAHYVENYLPHVFEDPQRAREWIKGRKAQLGPTWFQKERSFELITDALEAGLRLKYTNPEDMVTHRLLSSVDMVERMRLLHDMRQMDGPKDSPILGMAIPVKDLGNIGSIPLEDAGWKTITAPNGTDWMIELIAGEPRTALTIAQRRYREAALLGTAFTEYSLGHDAESKRALGVLIRERADSWAYQIAAIHAWRGERDQAFEWLERSYRQHDSGLTRLAIDPLLKSLRDDRRFKALLRRMNLPG